MSFNQTEIAYLGKVGLDAYLKNKPVDQIAVDRPLSSCFMKKKSYFTGGKQYITEQIRVRYSSNFQWYHGADAVSYNKRQTVEQTNFTWGSVHDGFTLHEDDLLSNGIVFNDEVKNASTKNERVQLTQLFNENMEVLDEGFKEKLDYELHLDGTQDSDAVAGLDHLISLDGTGVVGGIDASTNSYWANNFDTGIAGADLIQKMEVQWRKCTRNGGKPTKIIVGSGFLDEFRVQAKEEIARYTVLRTDGQATSMDPSVTGLHFKGVDLTWDPVFEDLDANLSPSIDWEKRCYFVNEKHVKYQPAKGHDMVTRTPPREYNRYVWYWALTHKFGLTTNRRNAHSVMSIA